ncbi:MAG: hypothetical protein KGQ57_17600 [Burkholderiales bacterium]|nr:hypothetical protein [Burkholderiales bacterium]
MFGVDYPEGKFAAERPVAQPATSLAQPLDTLPELLRHMPKLAYTGASPAGDAGASNALARTKVSADYSADEWRKWQTNAVHYQFRYNQLTQLPRSDAGKAAVAGMLDEALDKTVGYFNQYDVSQQQNEIAIEKMLRGEHKLLDAPAFKSGEGSGIEFEMESDDEW